MHAYPSDITRDEFNIINNMLENSRKTTKPRSVDLYDVFCAVLYVNKSGCQWRMLPSDFPKWSTVYSYFQIWTEPRRSGSTILSSCLELLTGMIRNEDLRKEKTTFLIVDSKSIQNADTAEEKGYDGGKKTSGIKIHIGVDSNGLPHSVHATTANVTDRDGALEMFRLNAEHLSDVEKVLADGLYTGHKFADSVKEILGAAVEVAKRSELHKFVVIPKRWVVERSFGWLDKCRRLWKNCERKIHNSLQMVILAYLGVFLHRF
jgi:transposase